MRTHLTPARALSALTLLPALTTAQSTLESCLDAASVPYHAPGSEAWDQDVAPFNTRLPYEPAAIVVATATEHIEGAVKCAVEAGVKVNAKAGGHSYASLGLGGEDGHLVVQMDRMHEVRLEGETAVVQGGARLGHVATELWEQGGLAISHGTCPGVGMGGHVLHGGFGLSSFTHGLALDGVTALTVTLANGTTVRATESSHADLFWALRGAGSSFGIVSEFEFETFVPPEELTHFAVKLGWEGAESIVDGWLELQKWGEEEMPREMNLRFSVDSGGAALDGLYHGGWEDAEGVVVPLVERLGGGNFTANVTYDWMGQIEHYAFTEDVNLTYPYNEHEKFYSKSLATHSLPRAALDSFVDYWLNTANPFLDEGSFARTWWILVDIHGGANSRVAEIPHDSTAYAHRDKLLLWQFYDRVFVGDYPSEEEEGFGLLDGFVESVTGELEDEEWGMYVNYADPRVGEMAENVYFGENVERLRGLKGAVDPEDVFYHPLGIKPGNIEE